MRQEVCQEKSLRGPRALPRGRQTVQLRAMRQDVQGTQASSRTHQAKTSEQSKRDTEFVRQHRTVRDRRGEHRSGQVHLADAGELWRVKRSRRFSPP